MRNLLYLLMFFLLVTSCKNVKKLVDKGEYDEAILYSLKKMEGEEHRETKYVRALEEAFAKVNRKDMDQVKFWKEGGNPADWPKIHSRLTKIQTRQERVKPYLPLISKDGYQAKFKFVKIYPLLNEARTEASNYHYELGSKLLEDSERKEDRFLARSAYREFRAIDRYYSRFKDVDEKLLESLDRGTTHVWLIVDNRADAFLPHDFNRALLRFNRLPRDKKWVQFYEDPEDGQRLDIKISMDINFLDVSPEREQITHHQDTKEVQHGFTYDLDENGNVKKDSLGNDIKIPNFKTVRSETHVLHQEKIALVQGEMRVLRMIDGRVLDKEPLKAEAHFSHYSISVEGDERATCDHELHAYSDGPLAFPHDLDLLGEAIDQLKEAVLDKSHKHVE